MRQILFLTFVLFLPLALTAQDKIITSSGDTIFCRIVSVSSNNIVYEKQVDKQYVAGEIIPIGDVAEYFREPVAQPSTIKTISRNPEKPWLLSLYFGGAHLPWIFDNVPDQSAANGYFKKLETGFTLNASAHYLITKNIGFGIQYSFFKSEGKSNDPMQLDSYNQVYSMMDISERQYINYAGISVIFRQFLDKSRKLTLSETLGGGLLLYRIESQSKSFLPTYSYYNYSSIPIYQYYTQFQDFVQNILMTGNTLCATGGISIEYKILPYFSIGVGGNFMYGNLSKVSGEYKISTGDSGKINETLLSSLNLSRIDYFLVLRFNL